MLRSHQKAQQHAGHIDKGCRHAQQSAEVTGPWKIHLRLRSFGREFKLARDWHESGSEVLTGLSSINIKIACQRVHSIYSMVLGSVYARAQTLTCDYTQTIKDKLYPHFCWTQAVK